MSNFGDSVCECVGRGESSFAEKETQPCLCLKGSFMYFCSVNVWRVENHVSLKELNSLGNLVMHNYV